MKTGAAQRSDNLRAAVTWTGNSLVYQRDVVANISGASTGSIFSDDRWSLHEVAGKPTATKRTLSFCRYPESWKDVAKRIACCMLNIDAPVTLIQRPNAMRTRLSPGSVVSHMESEIWPFICWLEAHGFHTLSEVTSQTLRQYGDDVAASKLSRSYKARSLWGATRFWLYAPYLPPSDQLGQPPWESEGTADLLGPANRSGENKTQPVHPQTISPLLLWALAVVGDFSDEILSATSLRDRLRSKVRQQSLKGDKERLSAFLDDFFVKWGGIPGVTRLGKRGAASQYIGAVARVSVKGIYTEVQKRQRSGQKVVELAPLVEQPSLFIRGHAVRSNIDYYEIDQLKRLLATGCMIVIAYLSGMRSEECRGLQRGCCNRIVDPDGAVRYEITAKSYKDALDSDGNAIHGGKIREEAWHVIEPVAKAVQVMESLHGEGYLFAEAAIKPNVKNRKGLVMLGNVISRQIASFVSWCNRESQRLGLAELIIPDDPAGPITMRRFRRTLAWFIYRQPAGRISLGIQYGHLQGMTSDGYGSRVATGLRDLFPMEEAFARAEALAEAAERLSEGEFVSGPAADRYIAGVEDFFHRFQGKYLTVRQAAELQRNPTFRIFDNGMQPLACCYDSSKALCHPDRKKKDHLEATPNLSRCDSRCPNVARTDSHIDGLKREIEWQRLQAHSELVPEPLRLRHQQRADSLSETVEKHQKDREKKVISNAEI